MSNTFMFDMSDNAGTYSEIMKLLHNSCNSLLNCRCRIVEFSFLIVFRHAAAFFSVSFMCFYLLCQCLNLCASNLAHIIITANNLIISITMPLLFKLFSQMPICFFKFAIHCLSSESANPTPAVSSRFLFSLKYCKILLFCYAVV